VTGEVDRYRAARVGRAAEGERLAASSMARSSPSRSSWPVLGPTPTRPGKSRSSWQPQALPSGSHTSTRRRSHTGVASDQHFSFGELRRIARRKARSSKPRSHHWPRSCWAPLGVISTQVAVWAAFSLGLVVLAPQGVTVARVRASRGRSRRSPVVAGNVSLGVLPGRLKLVVTH